MQNIKNIIKRSFFGLFFLMGLIYNTINAQTISRAAAIEDIDNFRTILIKESSYLTLKNQDFNSEVNGLIDALEDEVAIKDLYFGLMKILGNVGDRHARVKWEGLKPDTKGFPFIMAPMGNKIIALNKAEKGRAYQLFDAKFPELKAINGVAISDLIKQMDWAYKHAPSEAKYHKFALEKNINYFLDHVFGPKAQHTFVFTNGKQDKTMRLALDDHPRFWKDLTYTPKLSDMPNLFGIKGKHIGYISIPAMIPRSGNYGNLYQFVSAYMSDYADTEALIIDLRNNGGGTREFLMQLAPYFLAPQSEPWVANVAKIRSDQKINEDMESMQNRYLYTYKSKRFTDGDRKAIDAFMATFKATWRYDPDKYSEPFFMVLKHELGQNHYYYDRPVYVLVNERSFSAASVFTSAVKGMANVKIVGVNTDGSSGRSQYFDLKHSKINLKLSSMISFQRNGTTLDSYGTVPDWVIYPELDQVLGLEDTQLTRLIERIEQGKNN